MTEKSKEKRPLRFRWSHEHSLHRSIVRLFNKAMRFVPFSLKYELGQKMRTGSYPYRLVKPGHIVVQVGAPQDTLLSGRSRAMHFALRTGPTGRVFVVEPDPNSVQAFRRVAKQQHITHIDVFPVAAWSEKKQLTIYIDDTHPASNFTEGSKAYDAARLRAFRAIHLPANSLDALLAEKGIQRVDLVSITTNGAERDILLGMKQLMSAGIPYICLAVTGDNYVDMMTQFGYELFSYDDRGFTFRQIR
jgi:FkbM family methyltransferase